MTTEREYYNYCRKCGAKLPDGSRFCHKCGADTSIPSSPVSTISANAVQTTVSKHSAQDTAVPQQAAQKRPAVAVIILSILLCLALAGCGYLAFRFVQQSDGAAELNAKVNTLETENASLQTENSALKKTRDDYWESLKEADAKAKEYQPDAEDWENLMSLLSSHSYGYASSSFHLDTGVLLLSMYQEKQVTLTAAFGTNVTINVDAQGSAIYSFDEDTWYGDTTTLTISGLLPGASVLTFSNSVNSKTFDLLVIVTE